MPSRPAPTWRTSGSRRNQWLTQESLPITKTVTQAFTDGYIVMEGQGLPSGRATTLGQRRLTAQRAAEVVAYRNLAQFLDGVAVVGDRRQGHADTVRHGRTAVNAFIKGAQVIYKDYNDREGSATVLVKVGMNGTGELRRDDVQEASWATRHAPAIETMTSLRPAATATPSWHPCRSSRMTA